MVYQRHNLPTVNEIGRRLESEGLVAFGKRAYNQTDNNCVEVASQIAEYFGYEPISFRNGELINLIFAGRSMRRKDPYPERWAPIERFGHKSPANLVVRTPDNASQIHFAFEFCGREYNFGAVTRQGFPIEMRIPLYRQK